MAGWLRGVCASAILGAGLAAAAPAAADPVATARQPSSGISQEQALALSARLDALERRNTELEAQVQALRAQTEGEAAKAGARPTVDLANGRPSITSADGAFNTRWRGVFQLDAANYVQDAAGPASRDFRRGSVGDAGETDRARDLQDGTNFRRARIGLEGRAFQDWGYNVLYEFGGGGVEGPARIIAGWIQYEGFEGLRLRVGAFSPPSGMEEATSASGSMFLERASVAEVVRSLASGDGRSAAGVFANGERWAASAALSGGVAGQQGFDEPVNFVGRVAGSPLMSEAGRLHVGASLVRILEPGAVGPDLFGAPAQRPVRLRDRPEIRVDGTRLIDTGNLDADGATAWGLEFAAQLRNLYLQSERYVIAVDRRAPGVSDPDFGGWYVQGAWTLTGEPRRYDAASATFGPPRPDRPLGAGGAGGGWGALELAARYSTLDLNYLAGAPGTVLGVSGVRGGEQTSLTLGLNWYPNTVVRFTAGYQALEIDRLSPGDGAFGAATPPAGAQVGQDLEIWSLRAQYAF